MPSFVWIPLLIAGGALLAALAVGAVCFFKIFYAWRKEDGEEYPTPEGEIYDPYRPQMVEWIKRLRAMEHLDVKIKSRL